MARSATVTASLLFIASVAFTAVTAVLIRALTNAGVNAFEIAFFRNLFGLLFMLPWILRAGVHTLRTRHPGLHLLRAGFNLCSMVAFFWAVSLLPIADVVALNFTGPLFVSIGAVLVLGEVMRVRRWAATAAGFVGALVIIRPGFETVNPGVGLALLAAASWAGMQLLTKRLSPGESATAIVTLNLLIITPVSLLPALAVWQTPQPVELLLMLGHGVFGVANQFCVARAFRQVDAGVLMPLDFLRLPMVAGLAFVLFGEAPDGWTWAGAAIIFGASVYVAHRERRLAAATR